MTGDAARIIIVDYGLGNLLSVVRSFQSCGANPEITDNHDHIREARGLVLPGVGAFADGMAGLAARGLIDPIKQFAASGRPLLGICLGMQMLFEAAEEFGIHQGLAIISGRVVEIPRTGSDGRPHKIPHIGWNSLQLPEGHGQESWGETVLSEIEPGESVYFVHSFTAAPANNENRLADVLYDGRVIAAAVRRGNVYGCQFHPEKSGPVGLKIIRAFTELSSSL